MRHTTDESFGLVTVIGQGYVGLPLSLEASRAGYVVRGLELDPRLVDELNQGNSHVDDVSSANLSEMRGHGYEATTDPSVLAESSTIVICVPTPLGEGGSPDLRAVEESATAIAARLRPGTLVVLESTTYPGTTEQLLLPLLEASGLKSGTDFFLAFSPERIDPGNPNFGLRNTPKVVGGVDTASTTRATDFYQRIVDTVVPVRGAREAETAKLLENTYRHVNIALVNEMVRFCRELDIDLWDVIRAASTKPFGFQAFYPGPGVGGHCIPIDPNYLSYEVKRTLGYPFRFVELAQEINESMPRYVVDRLQDALNDVGKPLRGSRILLLGVTYKPNIADQRESPAEPIAELLTRKGAVLEYHDPHVRKWAVEGAEYDRVVDPGNAAGSADVTVLLQAHAEYDVDRLARNSRVFFDTRGITSDERAIRL